MSELRRKKQRDASSRPAWGTRFRGSVQAALALFCILLLTVSPAAADDARPYEDSLAATNTTPHPADIVVDGITTPGDETPAPDEIREQHIVRYVEENREADHGEGMRRNATSVLRQIAGLEDRGYDVADLRSALRSGDEAQVKEAFCRIQACVTGQ
jgi:hypothetical protein